MLELNRIYNEDCLGERGMCLIPDKSVDMILCDLPYGNVVDCDWDKAVPLEKLWSEYERIIKPGCTVVLFASQPFTTDLINSNRDWFRYELIWDKGFGRQPLLAKIQPMKRHENILVFAPRGRVCYNPLMVERDKPVRASNGNSDNHFVGLKKIGPKEYTHKYPDSLLHFKPDRVNVHPTQKPAELCEYLIRTFTDEGGTVLDNCMGSGTTAVAALQTKRNFIGFELTPEYHRIATERIANVQSTLFV